MLNDAYYVQPYAKQVKMGEDARTTKRNSTKPEEDPDHPGGPPPASFFLRTVQIDYPPLDDQDSIRSGPAGIRTTHSQQINFDFNNTILALLKNQ